MRIVTAEIEIDASPDKVWEVLSDLAAYKDWNPFFREASGDVQVGAKISLKMFPSKGRPMGFKPTVVTASPSSELRWIGRLIMPGVFDGEHSFTLSEAPDSDGARTVLKQEEKFSGVLVPLFGKTLDGSEADFQALNEALRKRVEDGPEEAEAAEPEVAESEAAVDEAEEAEAATEAADGEEAAAEGSEEEAVDAEAEAEAVEDSNEEPEAEVAAEAEAAGADDEAATEDGEATEAEGETEADGEGESAAEAADENEATETAEAEAETETSTEKKKA